MTKVVRLYPVPGVSVYPWPSEPFDASPKDAAFLLGHEPPPFTTDPPTAAEPTHEAPKGASSDSSAEEAD